MAPGGFPDVPLLDPKSLVVLAVGVGVVCVVHVAAMT